MIDLELVLGDNSRKLLVLKYRSKSVFGVKAIVAHERCFASIIASKYHDAGRNNVSKDVCNGALNLIAVSFETIIFDRFLAVLNDIPACKQGVLCFLLNVEDALVRVALVIDGEREIPAPQIHAVSHRSRQSDSVYF